MVEKYTQDHEGLFNCPSCDRCFYTKIMFKIHLEKEQCLNKQQIGQVNENKVQEILYDANVGSTVKSPTNVQNKEEFAQTQNCLPIVDCAKIPQQNQVFKEQAANSIFEKIHDRVKSHQCQECNKTYRQKAYLQTHINFMHNNFNGFSCLQCNRSFVNNRTLQFHIKAVHEKLKPYRCYECNKLFSINKSLQLHIDCVHKKLKPFQCQQCIMSFGVKGNLQRHIKVVHRN